PFGLSEHFGCGLRPQLEGGFDNDAKATTASHEQFAQVVAGDVFHDFAAGLDHMAIRQRHLDVDEIFTNGAITESARATGIRGKKFADGETRRVRRIDGQPLPMLVQVRLKRGQREARFNRRGHVFRGMLDDSIEAAQIDLGRSRILRGSGDQCVAYVLKICWLNAHTGVSQSSYGPSTEISLFQEAAAKANAFRGQVTYCRGKLGPFRSTCTGGKVSAGN